MLVVRAVDICIFFICLLLSIECSVQGARGQYPCYISKHISKHVIKSAAYGRLNQLKNALQLHGIDDHVIDTALIRAAQGGHAEVVTYLLLQGANLHCQNNDGWNPLMCAVTNGQIKVVQELFDRGASVLDSEQIQTIPLHVRLWHENNKSRHEQRNQIVSRVLMDNDLSSDVIQLILCLEK